MIFLPKFRPPKLHTAPAGRIPTAYVDALECVGATIVISHGKNMNLRLALPLLITVPLTITLMVMSPLGCAQDAKQSPRKPRETVGRIDRLDPALDELVAPDAKIEKLADGFEWSEGPVWVNEDGGCLLFSDVPRNVVYRWSERDGLQEYLKPSGFTGEDYKGSEAGSNGLALDKNGKLVLCQHGNRQVARLLGKPDENLAGEFEVIADRYEGKRFNSPNDLCFDKAGNLYFTDPPYGLSTSGDDAPEKELPFNGVFRVAPDGTVTVLTKDLSRPNGIALSPDQKILYVAQSDASKHHVYAFDVTADGVANGRIFFDAATIVNKGPSMFDGLKVDVNGNIFTTGPGGVLVITPEGKHLGTIRPSETEATANVAFGNDGSTLYLTNDSTLCRIKLKTKGAGF